MSTMTLEQVRDWHLAHTNYVHLPITNRAHKDMADAIDAHLAQPAQAVDVGAEDRFEQYVATRIAKSPNVRELGERLSRWLDDDQFNNVEPILLGIARALSCEKAGPVGDGWRVTAEKNPLGGKPAMRLYAPDGRSCLFATFAEEVLVRDFLATLVTASPAPDKEGM